MYRNIYYSAREQCCHLFTWDENGNRIVKKEPFFPYFYIETNSDQVDGLSIFNTKLKKKTFKSAFERNKAAQDGAIKRIYHNVQVEQQFLIDTFKDEYDKPEFTRFPLKVCFLDIEVDTHIYHADKIVKVRLKGSKSEEKMSLGELRAKKDIESYEVLNDQEQIWTPYYISIYTKTEFPETDEVKHPINLLTIYDSLTSKFYTWGIKPYTPKKENAIYFHCKSESDLFLNFLKFWTDDFYPDILSGWNANGFDFPYLINRITKVLSEEHAKKLSPVNSIWCRKGIFIKGQEMDKWNIHGISCVDYLELYKTFPHQPLESYSLNFVAQHELGEGKLAINASNLAQLAETDWENFVDYNIQDVELLVRIDQKKQHFKILRMLAYKGLTDFDRAQGKVVIVTGAVALAAYKQGMIIPTFVGGPTRDEIEGGFVKEPDKGRKTAVVSYDANSLYPNTIITLNISPETKVGKIISKTPESVTILLASNKEYTLPTDKFIQFVQNEKIAISKANVLYTQKTKGVVPTLIDSLYNERVSAKKLSNTLKKKLSKITKEDPEYISTNSEMERYDALQNVIKLLLNSIYGVFANKFSPICDSDHAGSITLTGQAVVKQASVIIDQYAKEKYGYEDKSLTLYSDTDSCHVTIQPILDIAKLDIFDNNKVTKKGLELIDDDLGVYLNNKIKEWAGDNLNSVDPRYFFKREAICDVGVYLQKKRYILHILDNEGVETNKFKYVGVQIAASATPKKAKELIKKVIENTLLEHDQVKANSLYRSIYESFKNLPRDDVALRGGLSDLEKGESKSDGFAIGKGTANHVKGALWYNELLRHYNLDGKYEMIGSGSKVKKIYILPNKFKVDTLCYTGTFPVELEEEFKVDYVEMFDGIIKPPVKSVYEALTWELPDINNEVTTNIFELFS